MDLLSMLLGAQNQERSITIKTKPNQEKAAPEQPLSNESANLPPEVMQMLASLGGAALGGGAPNPAIDQSLAGMQGQVPMDMANPYGG
jgi:hypothetical protein